MKRKIRKKLTGSSGFSMLEILLAIMILLMASYIVADNMGILRKVFTELTESANAQLLLSTTMVRLRDELGYATEVYQPEDTETEIRYRNGGAEKRIYSENQNTDDPDNPENIIKTGYCGYPDHDNPFVSAEEATNGLTVEFDSVSLHSVSVSAGGDGRVDSVTFHGLRVMNKERDLTLAACDTYVIRTIARPKIRSLQQESGGSS